MVAAVRIEVNYSEVEERAARYRPFPVRIMRRKRIPSSLIGDQAMSLMIEAIYENGILKPTQPLPLKEHEKVRLAVLRAPSVAEQTYGLIGWTGDAATLERLALDPQLDPQESAGTSRFFRL